MHVSGTEDEAVLEASGAGTTEFLLNNAGIALTDVVLEIGCGVGRVGSILLNIAGGGSARTCRQIC